MHVLLVDDNEKIRSYLLTLLVAEGYTVTQADNGLSALSCFKKNKFDAVVVDYKMPIMDGLKLCENIIFEYQYPVDQITVLSTEVDSHFKAKIAKWKLSWLPKPIQTESLIARLAQLQQTAAA